MTIKFLKSENFWQNYLLVLHREFPLYRFECLQYQKISSFRDYFRCCNEKKAGGARSDKYGGYSRAKINFSGHKLFQNNG